MGVPYPSYGKNSYIFCKKISQKKNHGEL